MSTRFVRNPLSTSINHFTFYSVSYGPRALKRVKSVLRSSTLVRFAFHLITYNELWRKFEIRHLLYNTFEICTFVVQQKSIVWWTESSSLWNCNEMYKIMKYRRMFETWSKSERNDGVKSVFRPWSFVFVSVIHVFSYIHNVLSCFELMGAVSECHHV